MAAYLASACTGVLTGFLIAAFHLEYAPVVAVIISCPLWRLLASFEAELRQKIWEEPEEEDKEEVTDGSAERV